MRLIQLLFKNVVQPAYSQSITRSVRIVFVGVFKLLVLLQNLTD